MDPVVTGTLCLVLALLFGGGALRKTRDLVGFAAIVEHYELLPRMLVSSVAGALVASEGALALLLVVPATRELGALGAAGMLLVYSAAIGINLARGRRDIDCGCAGAAVGRRGLAPELLARNALLLGAALLAALPVETRPLVWLDPISIALGVVTLALTWNAAGQLAATAPALLRRRMSA